MIDSAAVSHWVMLNEQPATASSDGNYFSYGIEYQEYGDPTLVVQSIKDSWKKEFLGVREGFFSSNSKEFILQSGDSLFIVELGTRDIKTVMHVSSYKQQGGKWLAWQSGTELVLHNLLTGTERKYSSVTDYSFDQEGRGLVIKTETNQDRGVAITLKQVSLLTGDTALIWQGEPGVLLSSYVMNASGSEMAFWVQDKKGGEAVNAIWYYQEGMGKANEKVNNQSPESRQVFLLDEDRGVDLSNDGRYIYFYLREPEPPKAAAGATQVDIWSYRDTVLQSLQLKHLEPRTFEAVMCTECGKVIRLERDYEQVSYPYSPKGDFIVVRYNPPGDQFWLKNKYRYYLVSLKDGSRKLILTNEHARDFWYSPGGRYLLYYKDDNYYSYDLKGGKESNISESVPDKWLTLFFVGKYWT